MHNICVWLMKRINDKVDEESKCLSCQLYRLNNVRCIGSNALGMNICTDEVGFKCERHSLSSRLRDKWRSLCMRYIWFQRAKSRRLTSVRQKDDSRFRRRALCRLPELIKQKNRIRFVKRLMLFSLRIDIGIIFCFDSNSESVNYI